MSRGHTILARREAPGPSVGEWHTPFNRFANVTSMLRCRIDFQSCKVIEATYVVVERIALDAVEHHSRSEEHTSELQSLMRISYAVFCLKKKTEINIKTT